MKLIFPSYTAADRHYNFLVLETKKGQRFDMSTWINAACSVDLTWLDCYSPLLAENFVIHLS